MKYLNKDILYFLCKIIDTFPSFSSTLGEDKNVMGSTYNLQEFLLLLSLSTKQRRIKNLRIFLPSLIHPLLIFLSTRKKKK